MDYSRSKFLVVDDSAMVCDLIEGALQTLGANRIDLAFDGKEALNRIKKSYHDGMPYNLITLDWEMPEMSGLELLKLMRADPLMKAQPVLMISSKSSPEELKQLAPLQPSGFIVKPFTAEMLVQRVKALLGA